MDYQKLKKRIPRMTTREISKEMEIIDAKIQRNHELLRKIDNEIQKTEDRIKYLKNKLEELDKRRARKVHYINELEYYFRALGREWQKRE